MRAAAGDHLKVVRYLVEERDTELHSAGRSSCITEEMHLRLVDEAIDRSVKMRSERMKFLLVHR